MNEWVLLCVAPATVGATPGLWYSIESARATAAENERLGALTKALVMDVAVNLAAVNNAFAGVTDNGRVAMAPARQQRIVSPFIHAGSSTTRRYGSGQGLTIRKQTVALMGGRIGVRSMPPLADALLTTPVDEREVALGAAPRHCTGSRREAGQPGSCGK